MRANSASIATDGSKRERDINYTSSDGFYLRHYPATLIVLLAWIGYIILLLFLLNDISQATSAKKIFGIREERLVEFMLVIFAQAHGPITAAILARLAISSLQNINTAPRTWAELFWLADRSWQGPVAISSTYFTMVKRQIWPSTTFVLFSATYALSCEVAGGKVLSRSLSLSSECEANYIKYLSRSKVHVSNMYTDISSLSYPSA
jgi:hypothetical protein